MAIFTIWVDASTFWSLDKYIPMVYSSDVNSIRSLLGTIAAAMITVTSIAFSITIVALTLASSQFGPRLMRNFMKDRTTQIVLGVFISNFLYCILVFCALSLEAPYNFKPGITIIWAIAMTFISMGFLIHFIHHVSISIQADAVIEDVYCELKNSIDKLFPNQIQQTQNAAIEEIGSEDGFTGEELRLDESGYVQLIDLPPLLKKLNDYDLQMNIHFAPGNYVIKGSVFANVFYRDSISDEAMSEVKKHIVLGSARTPVQDPEFAVGQLVEVALRALSPGINDPFTAITCIDKLSSALCNLSAKQFPNIQYKDDNDFTRLECKALTFSDIGSAAFDQIRQHSEDNTAVTISLIDSLHEIALRANNEEQYSFVFQQLNMICEQQEQRIISSIDAQEISDRMLNVRNYLEANTAV
jgi:uncharacterized membrane protein